MRSLILLVLFATPCLADDPISIGPRIDGPRPAASSVAGPPTEGPRPIRTVFVPDTVGSCVACGCKAAVPTASVPPAVAYSRPVATPGTYADPNANSSAPVYAPAPAYSRPVPGQATTDPSVDYRFYIYRNR